MGCRNDGFLPKKKVAKGKSSEKFGVKKFSETVREVIESYLAPTSRPALSGEHNIQLSEINFSKLEVVSYKSRQVMRMLDVEKLLPRIVMRDETYFYKVWRNGYQLHRVIIVNGKRKHVNINDSRGVERLPGFLFNLFDEELVPAFAGGIYMEDKLVGYRMLAGVTLPEFEPSVPAHQSLLSKLTSKTLSSGFVYRDFKPNNIITLPDGRLSLIDLDTPLASIYRYSPDAEARSGSMASFTIPAYRDFLTAQVSNQADSAVPWANRLPSSVIFARK